MSFPLYIVDAFTEQPFGGNPAAVCLLNGPQPDDWLKSVAAEMNLSETAFTWPEGETRRLRWLTPKVEVDLCGHATLATAHVLQETGRARGTIHFETRSGRLMAEERNQRIELDFPALPPRMTESDPELIAALELVPIETGTNGMDAFVLLARESDVRNCKPDFRRLSKINVRGVIVTAIADEGRPYDFVSRFFAPASGVDEDPVTGSAHCCLAPFWEKRLGRSPLVGFQASCRGGLVHVRCDRDRVILSGTAKTIVTGTIHA